MPSFDVVSEVDMHEVTNAVDQSSREVGTRFDFKGANARFEQKEAEIKYEYCLDGIRRFIKRYCRIIESQYNRATVIEGEVNERFVTIIKALAELGMCSEFSVKQAAAKINNFIKMIF